MHNNRISLKQGRNFHGHLGPYLVLGILAGETALKKLNAEKYFGLDVEVRGAQKKPKSCLIDGLQLSTGATYGKGNLRKLNGAAIKIIFRKRRNNQKIALGLKDEVIKKLDQVKSHRDSEILARQLYKTRPLMIFNLTPDT
jgi:formylmethanofuran dehydrogenase subunit E